MSERVASVSRLLYRKVGHTHKTNTQEMVKRQSKLTRKVVTTESIDFKTPHSAKTKQAWKYKNNNIVRHPTVTINGTPYTDHKDAGEARRKQESNFFITINSNKAPCEAEGQDDVVKAMERVLKHLQEERVLARCIRFGPKHPEHYSADKYADVIHSLDFKGAVETGDKQKRVHAHIWLTVTHYSQIQLNIQMLQHETLTEYNKALSNIRSESKYFIEALPYVCVKLLPQSDWTDVMRQYIHKAMTECVKNSDL